MLIPMLIQQPQMLATVLRSTPGFVWVLLAALIALGVSQARDREASLLRVAVLPVAMTSLGIWGMTTGFGASPMFGYAMLVWMLAVSASFALVGTMRPPRGAEYHPATRTFFLPGSWAPLLLIMGIFLTRYVVNVDLAMQPALARDGQYTLIVSAVYGLCSGIFIGRAARLWRLAAERAGSRAMFLQRDPW
jgi:hypothetical protein